MINLENLSSLELKELLKKLKLYKDLTNNLGKRGEKIFNNIINNTHTYKVEYYPTMDKKDVKDESLEIIEKIFSDKINESEIKFLKKEFLKGGLRVFKDDNLVDLSFKKTFKTLK